MSYVVYFDRMDAREYKIHYTTCPHFQDRKRDASTTEWSHPYPIKRDASRETGVKREAKCSGV